MLNKAIVMGRLGADPELRKTPSGVSVTSFQIATNRTHNRELTDWFTIVAWRQQAEFITKYFQKGSLIIVEGSLETRSYEDKQGNKRTVVEVKAEQVHFGESSPSTTSARQGASRQASKPVPAPVIANQQQNIQTGFTGDGQTYAQDFTVSDLAEYEEIDTDDGELPF